MKVYKLTDDQVNNINIRSEFFEVKDEGVDRLWSLFSLYNGKRSKENYSKEAFDNLVKTDRFAYGATVTYIDEKPSLFYGLGQIENWIITTRAVGIFHFTYDLPIFLGHSLPFVIDRATTDKKSGLIMTFNENNKRLLEMSYPPKKITSKYRDHPIYQKYLNTVYNLQSIDHMVWYQHTKQYVRYMNFNGDEFPKEYFKDAKP